MSKDRFSKRANGLAGFWAGLGLAVVLSGCTNLGQPGPQPDDAASTGPASATPAVAASDADAAQQAAGAAPEMVSVTKVVTKTTWYRVQRGETLNHVAQKMRVPVRELEAWNRLKPSSRLRPGQSLKILSKQTITVQAVRSSAAGAAAGASGGVDAREVNAEVDRHATRVTLAWPAQGQVIQPFQQGETRGIEIAGNAGDPVRAAADGKVMYAGTGLNGYGSLIIVEHNKDFLTAYSHNRRLLVKTGDVVRQGQQIAEMGDENSPRVAVLFELRRDGKPIDPMPYLPHRSG